MTTTTNTTTATRPAHLVAAARKDLLAALEQGMGAFEAVPVIAAAWAKRVQEMGGSALAARAAGLFVVEVLAEDLADATVAATGTSA
jgi:hypothetical protein